MESIKMKTGIKPLQEINPEQNAFILSFLAIIFRRVWITAQVYADHNDLKITSDIVLKCLKYNVLAETGIGNLLKPYLVKALTVGFLMPKDYENSLYAKRAVMLFGDAYKICSKKDKSKEEELKFIHDYASSVFKNIDPFLQRNIKESIDLMADITKVESQFNYDEVADDLNLLNINSKVHHCELCDLIDVWDVKMELVHSEDPYNNVIIAGLMRCFESHQH